jgi:hypothetical protein
MTHDRSARIVEGTLRDGRVVELDEDLGAGARRLTLVVIEEPSSARGPAVPPQRRSLTELIGLGSEIWKGVDAQEYVNELRREWDDRDARSR